MRILSVAVILFAGVANANPPNFQTISTTRVIREVREVPVVQTRVIREIVPVQTQVIREIREVPVQVIRQVVREPMIIREVVRESPSVEVNVRRGILGRLFGGANRAEVNVRVNR